LPAFLPDDLIDKSVNFSGDEYTEDLGLSFSGELGCDRSSGDGERGEAVAGLFKCVKGGLSCKRLFRIWDWIEAI
jgi:hypothetical protein